MKKIILAALVAICITACNQKGQNTEDQKAQWKEANIVFSTVPQVLQEPA